MGRASYYFAFASVLCCPVSIAACQILLGLSLAALLLSGARLEFPPIRLPLAIFFASTVGALLLSGDPVSGLPQVRKFYVFATLLVISSTFRSLKQLQALMLGWAGAATVSAAMGLAQFWHRRQESVALRADSYAYMLDGRITGFAGHWMTFGGEEMIVALMLAAFLLFSQARWKALGWAPLFILLAAITLGMTRSIFLLGVPVGLLYLVWQRNWRWVALVPLAAVGGIATAPAAIQERIVSVVKPHGDTDSNSHRSICRAAGWEMVKAHPWFGLGPEQVGRQFDRYVPASVRRPLPAGWYGHLHNIYLQYWAERGIVGLLAVLWLTGKCLWDFSRRLRDGTIDPAARFLLQGGIAVILAVLAEGYFEYNLGDSEVLTSFLAVMACGYTAIRLSYSRSSTMVAPDPPSDCGAG